jgi:NAD(P)-dependent dehydrogenase (short-subunit alcohol dehydrogenase family)
LQNFAGRVAVVTGAASGIGLALASRFAEEGMRVVLADIEEQALEDAVTSLRQREHDVLGVLTDVSKPQAVDDLAQKAFETYGGVNILCNNAGVGGAAVAPWEVTLNDWQWTLGVNLWGVINGIRAFVPEMLERDDEGHVVNTASIAGLIGPGVGTYSVSKHAVVGISEWLYRSLERRGAKVGASVLCPGYVRTNINTSERNRPSELQDELPTTFPPQLQEVLEAGVESGLPPEDVAGLVLEAIRNEQFWIRTENDFDDDIRARTEHILERRNPAPSAYR